MPVLSSSASSLANAEILQDIVENLSLEDDGGIRYRQHPYEPPTEQFSERLHQLAPELKRRYWILQCRSFLYGFYFSRSDWRGEPDLQGESSEQPGAAAAQASDEARQDGITYTPLANNCYKGLDIGFYDALVASNCGEGYFDPGWQVVHCHGKDYLSVQKSGLTLEVERNVHLPMEERDAKEGDEVAVKLPAQRVEAERYIALGNQGFSRDAQTRLQVFFNLQAEGAAVLMGKVTKRLNGQNIPFQLQVLSHPGLYGQGCDGAILEIERRDYDWLRESLLRWGEMLPLLPNTLPMTQQLFPGISVAELLTARSAAVGQWQSRSRFGLQRCEAIAEGLIMAQQQGRTDSTGRYDCILAALERWGVHPQLLYLNRGSDAIAPLK